MTRAEEQARIEDEAHERATALGHDLGLFADYDRLGTKRLATCHKCLNVVVYDPLGLRPLLRGTPLILRCDSVGMP
jgi:hypothetical protein